MIPGVHNITGLRDFWKGLMSDFDFILCYLFVFHLRGMGMVCLGSYLWDLELLQICLGN